MTETIKVLGQLVPGSVLSTLYTVGAARTTTVSTVVVSNRDVSAGSFRISVAVAGAADDPKQYLYYDVPIKANDSFAATLGITLATTDVVRCYGSSSLIAFNLFGVEVS